MEARVNYTGFLFFFAPKTRIRNMTNNEKEYNKRLGRILNGRGTRKVGLKCCVAIQRWFESTRECFFSYIFLEVIAGWLEG